MKKSITAIIALIYVTTIPILAQINFSNNFIQNNASALGVDQMATGEYSFAGGEYNQVDSKFSFVFGEDNFLNAPYSFSFGFDNSNYGDYSVTCGRKNEVSGIYAFAGGNNCTSSGYYSFSYGLESKATGDYALAFGKQSYAVLAHSAAIGEGTYSRSIGCLAIGRFNEGLGDINDKYQSVFEVGIGTSLTTRKNALTIRGNGFVGIGTSEPEALLHIGNSSQSKIVMGLGQYLMTWGSTTIETNAHFSPKYSINPSQNLGSSFHRWNNLYIYNNIYQTSDRAFKENIQPLSYGLDAVMMLGPVSYQWREHEDRRTKVGFIAQEVHEVIPEVVMTDRNDSGEEIWGMDYTKLIPVLVNAIQEQNQLIDKQATRLDELENLIAKMNESVPKESIPKLNYLQPNPWEGQTNISYYLPDYIQHAQLQILDENGHIQKTIQLNGRGRGEVVILQGDLRSGLYYLTLMADQYERQTQKMIIR